MLDTEHTNQITTVPDGTTVPRSPSTVPLAVAGLIGGAVALSLGVYGRTHQATGEQVFDLGFPTLLDMKAWLTTAAFVLALAQLATALMMWERLPRFGIAAATVATTHRWSGTAAFILTLPVAYHCLWALGFQDTTTRVLLHSILGCFFYGAISTKLLLLRIDNLPNRTLPVVGGALVAGLTAIWLTSSLWYFTAS